MPPDILAAAPSATTPDAAGIESLAIVFAAGAYGREHITYVNAAFTRMTGYEADEAFGRPPSFLQGPGTSLLERARVREALRTGEPVTAKLLNYRKDGTTFWHEIRVTPVHDHTGARMHWLSISRDVSADELSPGGEHSALAQAQAQLDYVASHDELTGAYNRSAFIQRLSEAVERSHADAAYRFAVLYLDLDRFKLINERFGWVAGDRVLRDVAVRLSRCIRASDVFARIDGDAFAVLIDIAGQPGEVLGLASRLQMEVAARTASAQDDVTLGASVAIVHSCAQYHNAQDIMRDAETALQSASRTSGATAIFEPAMRDAADVAARTRNDLQGAVQRGEMRLYYQPLTDIAMGRVYGFEALVRWQHPQRGLVAPGAFIDVAEANGTIIDIGRWVLQEGCRAARVLAQAAGRQLLMSVNVSSWQLLDPHFLTDLRAAIEAADLDPRSLQIEITESVFLAGPAVIGELFAQIRALGVRIALDDFGTGYSSLSYLESFQIDTLKIDQSFVARIDHASAKSEIVRMIIALAHAIGVDVVAEGVEKRSQRDALGRLGCTHLQGYLYSRPVPLMPAVALVLENDAADQDLRALLGETREVCGAGLLDEKQREQLHAQVVAALDAHQVWMDRLQTAVSTGTCAFDLDDVAREDLCPIGVWLNVTIPETVRRMPLYYVTKARHAVFHRSAARLLAGVVAGEVAAAAASLRPDGDFRMVASSLLATLIDWLAIADGEAARTELERRGSR